MIGIIVNGNLYAIEDHPGETCATYEDIVFLAGRDPMRFWTVTYGTRRKGDEQRQGSLRPLQSTRIEEGMVFNVADTSNA